MKVDNKTIGITLRFFTNGLPDKVGMQNELTPFWTIGNAVLESNKTKGLRCQSVIFHSLEEIPGALREIMRRAKLAPITHIRVKNK